MGMRERDGASLVAQLVKNPPVTQEPQKTWVRSLGQENSLEEGMATTPVFLLGESHGYCPLGESSPREGEVWGVVAGGELCL